MADSIPRQGQATSLESVLKPEGLVKETHAIEAEPARGLKN